MKLETAFETWRLNKFCSMKDDEFFQTKVGTVYSTINGRLLYVDNGSPVLAVAHIDTAIGHEPLRSIYHKNANIGVSAALDDRLGVYTICELLPRMGIMPDILLTEGEESGMSTAQDFDAEKMAGGKQWNWMFQFDRHGLDPVLYEYDTTELRTLLAKYGYKVAQGSFSDICYLEHLKIAGINFGTAYYNEHSLSCHMDYDEYLVLVGKFINFFNNEQAHAMPHTPRSRKAVTNWWPTSNYAYPTESGYYASKYNPETKTYEMKFCTWEMDKKDALPKPPPASNALIDMEYEWAKEIIAMGGYYDEHSQTWWLKCPACNNYVPEEDYSFRADTCLECVSKGKR